jgi:aminopeptidase N
MEHVSGRNLDRFFADWVYAPGHPDVEITLAHADGLLSVTVNQKQEDEGVPEAYVLPLTIVVKTASTEETIALTVRERTRTFTLPCPEAPTAVWVDPNMCFLADLSIKAPRDWLLEMLRNGPCPVLRIRAATALAEEGSHRALNGLVDAMTTESFWGVRADIASLLGKKGGETARKTLLGGLKTEPHLKALHAIVVALGSFRHDDVYTALADLATQGHASIRIEGEAAKTLGKLRAPQAQAVCTALLARDSWGELLRSRGLQGLGATRDADVLPVLMQWLQDERPVRARIAACAAVGQLADEVPEIRAEVVDVLCRLAKNGRFRLRLAAVSALGRTRDRRAAATLHQIHQSDSDGRLRRMAYEALKKVNAGRDGEEALGTIRNDLEKLQAEHRELVDRMVKVEGASSV